jgi:hypothetical protein
VLKLERKGILFKFPMMKLPPLCLSSVATELGYRFTSGDLLTIGKTLKAAYVGVYEAAPEQHEQVVGGAAKIGKTLYQYWT